MYTYKTTPLQERTKKIALLIRAIKRGDKIVTNKDQILSHLKYLRETLLVEIELTY